MCLLGEEITGKRLGEPGDTLSSQRELSTPSAFQPTKVNFFILPFAKVEAVWNIWSFGSPKVNSLQTNGRAPISVALHEKLQGNECHRKLF